MTLFSWNKKSHAQSVALIEIGVDSLGGAYARFEPGKGPLILYSTRITFEPHASESRESALARGLRELGQVLVQDGIPVLVHEAGSGKIDAVAASVDVPWQETLVRIEHIESAQPFVFTRAMLAEAVAKSSQEPEGRLLVDESVIATMLNGYLTGSPIGKSASRARIVILASSIDRLVAEQVASALRSLYHSRDIELTSFSAASYHALKVLFPHQEELLIVESRSSTLSTSLVKRQLMVATATARYGNDRATDLLNCLKELSQHSPLPHTILLLAPEAEREELREMIINAHPEALWLSDTPPLIVPVTPETFMPRVEYSEGVKPDLFLALLALSYAQRAGDREVYK